MEGFLDDDQALGVLIRQRLDEHAVHHAEDHRVDADPEREAQDGDGGEDGRRKSARKA